MRAVSLDMNHTGAAAPRFLAGGGEMGALIRAKDWSQTPLGPIEAWPQSLRTAVDLMLSSRYAMFVWWGRALTNLYNDAYRPFLGVKHPAALGRSARDVWAEIWDLIGPRTEAVLDRGEATFDEALLLLMERYGYPEETYFTFSYSPIRDDRGIGGIFCAVMETTLSVIGERRLKLLRDVAANAPEARTRDQVCKVAAECIAGNTRDLPFAMLYLSDGEAARLRLAARAGIGPDSPAAPSVADLENTDGAWPFAEARATGASVLVENLASRFEGLPKGAWDRPPTRAVIVPLSGQGQNSIAGYLVAGLNPYLPYDEGYRGFIDLLAGQIAAAIANAGAYEQERQRAEALAEIDRAKTLFFSNVSHEFRTPLTLMLGPIEDALADPGLPAAERERLEVAHRNSLRLLKLVNALLDFSRIEAGRARASYEPTDLAAFTAELASNFRSACERAGLTLRVGCPPLPEPVYVDREMWEKIVLNLLSNAFKFTFEGEIAVSLRAVDGNVELTVRDTGVGIPEHALPRLFERFHRIEGQRSRTHEGSGIGLSLVQELVKLHGGSIAAESTAGHGCAFTVRVPLGTAHLPQDQLGAERQPAASTAIRAEAYVQEALRWLPDGPPAEMARASGDAGGCPGALAGAHVLVADDNADMRAYVRRLLGPDFRVESVADGEAALAAIRAHRPDLVLADVMMPRLDGFGLLRAIRADPALRGIPVIMLSARAGEESRVEGLEAGADGYLVKPFSARELIARVGGALELARVRRDAMATLRDNEQRTRELFQQAPGFMCILTGAEHVFAFANEAYRRLVGGRDLLGKTIREAFPELAGQGFFERLDEVYRGGKPFIGRGTPVELRRAPGGPLERVVVDFIYQPVTDKAGAVTGVFVEGFEITDRVAAQAELARLAAEAERQRRLYETIFSSTPDLVYVFDLNYRFTYVNRALLEMWGRTLEESVGKSLLEIGYEPWHAAMHEREIDQVIATKQPIRGEVPFPHATLGQRIYDYIFVPVINGDGEVEAIAGTTRDITERKRAEEHRELLIGELNHRVKNTLATVQSMAMQTLRSTERSADARELFESRLAALSRAHDVLTAESWEGADLLEIAARALEPFGGTDGRVTVGGPAVRLTPKQALGLSMAFHELATNAAKYGALSNHGGRVAVTWRIAPGNGPREVQLTWTEAGGPPVAPPTRRGFGSRLIERGLADELGGEVRIEYRRTGVVAFVRCPLPAAVA